MPRLLVGRILLVNSSSPKAKQNKVYATLARVNHAIDCLTMPDEKRRVEQHQMISEAMSFRSLTSYTRMNTIDQQVDPKTEAQNVLSGAIIIGDLPLVTSLLSSASPLDLATAANTESPYFSRPLQLATACGHVDIVRYLLECGADPHASTDPNLNRREDDNKWDPSGRLALGDRYDCRSTRGSALRVAVLGGHEDIVRLLLYPEYRLSPTKAEYFRAIVAGARGGHINLIRLLIETAGQENVSKFEDLEQEILWEAARHNQYEVVQMSQDNGINVNVAPYPSCRGYGNALCIAASRGHTNIVRLLLERGADVNLEINNHGYAIEDAAVGGHEEVVEMLLDRGANLDRALVSAAGSGQVRLVRHLLGKDVNLLTHKWLHGSETVGMEALRHAILCKNPTVISLLVDAGAPLNDGYAAPDLLPIVMAKMFAAEWIVKFLLSIGAADQEVDEDMCEDSESPNGSFLKGLRVRVTKRTWEWIGKY